MQSDMSEIKRQIVLTFLFYFDSILFFCVGRQHLWSATLVFYGVDIVTADWEKCYAAARLTMIYQGGIIICFRNNLYKSFQLCR